MMKGATNFDWRDDTFGGPVEALMPVKPFNGIAVVGKAPGSTEVITGVPFAGRSGKLLDKILAGAGIDREAIILANPFRYQPAWTVGEDGKRRENDESLFFTDEPLLANDRLPAYQNRRLRKGPDEDVRILWRLLQKEKPAVIIACGAIAIWSLTGRDQVGNLSGTFLETACVKAPVMATYHPAYALRRDDDDAAMKIMDDFVTARKRAEEMMAARACADRQDTAPA